jgi:uncharacterized membrane protein YdjX (TVP38/TMEM64 family)
MDIVTDREVVEIPESEKEIMAIQNSENDQTYVKRRRNFSLISLAILIAVFTTATAALWKPLTSTFQNPERFRAWVNSNGILGRLAFAGIDALQVIFAILPGEPVELGAGYAFGTVEGTVLCLIGDAIGTTAVFLFTKLLGIKLVEACISREKIQSLRFIKNSGNLNLLIFILFFIPGTPKDIITYVIGLTPMKLGTFLIIASIARIPSVLTSTITGDALGVQNYKTAVIVYAVTGGISLAGILIYRRILRQSQKDKAEANVQEKS